jgi:NarL family two-component system response regulator LiaR
VAKQTVMPKTTLALTTREREILTLLATGLRYQQIGESLGVTTGTVKQHLHKIYGKLEVTNKTEAINRFRDW